MEPFFLSTTAPTVSLFALAQNLGSNLQGRPNEDDDPAIKASPLLLQAELNRISDEHAVRVIVGLLGKYFNGTAEEPSCFRRCLSEVAGLVPTQRSRAWNEIVVIIGSLPDRIANLMRRHTPAQFAPVAFFDSVVRECLLVVDSVSSANVDVTESPIATLGLISQVFSKICNIGRAACVSSALVSQLMRRCSQTEVESAHFVWLDYIRQIVKNLQVTAFEPFLDAFLFRLDGVPSAELFLQCIVSPLLQSQHATSTYLLTSKVPSARVLPYNVVCALVRVLRGILSEEKFVDVLCMNSDMWGSVSFIQQASFPQQNRVWRHNYFQLEVTDTHALSLRFNRISFVWIGIY